MLDKEFYENAGIRIDRDPKNKIYKDSPLNTLIERAVKLGYGKLTKHGAMVVETGKHTERSAADKYVVKSPRTAESIWWENGLNEQSPEQFESLRKDVLDYLNEDRDLYITERSVGAHEAHNVGVRLVTSHPQHSLFSKYLFRHRMRELNEKDFLILHAPEMEIDPKKYGAKNPTIITTCFDTNVTIIVGTLYAGEIKKSMFSVLNYILPEAGILPMHAGANELTNGETGVFFGLSGTGKTTLSTDEGTLLIGDDEHGMSDNGVFNFEGGCYAKTYKLSAQGEPEIWSASNRFGSMLENVVLTDKTGEPDFFNNSLTENGRSSYPLDFIDELKENSNGQVPSHIFFLTADAFGVLPPVAKLTKEQAMFYFVLGYTAKLAGTEIGVKEPMATFSPCFGAPFMLRHPSEYAKLLGEYLDRHNIKVWLINTGWTGGSYGVGQRFPLLITRQIVRTIQKNVLNITPFDRDEIFGFDIPHAVRKVPTSFLHPKEGWEDKVAYDKKAKELAESFHNQMKNFGSFYTDNLQGSPIYGR